MERLTKRLPNGAVYIAIADNLCKEDQEIQGSKQILEGIYAILQKLAEYEDKDEARKPIDNGRWSPKTCPTCGYELSESLGDGYYKDMMSVDVCPQCKQSIEWDI